jgi:hypothetical protein
MMMNGSGYVHHGREAIHGATRKNNPISRLKKVD